MPASDPLSRLALALTASPAMYLADSGISTYPGSPAIRDAIGRLVADQRGIADRVVELLDRREMMPPRAGYPLAFTAWHDLDLSALVPRVVERLRDQVSQCTAIAAAAGQDAAAEALAREAGECSRRHADALAELEVRQRAGLNATAG